MTKEEFVLRMTRMVRGASYRVGWYLFREGCSFEMCINDDMRAGWRASWRADEALRQVGVRG